VRRNRWASAFGGGEGTFHGARPLIDFVPGGVNLLASLPPRSLFCVPTSNTSNKR
jgi:hypothetical protein